MDLHELKFPIGEFKMVNNPDKNQVLNWIKMIAEFPDKVIEITKGMTEEEKNWRYRPEGWKIKQVVHHCSDSHMNSFIRFKLALTEKEAVIRPYYEDRWGELSDSLQNDLSDSLLLLKSLHSKWSKFLTQLTEEELSIEFIHPEHGTRVSLEENIAFYAWHCGHHYQHIVQAKEYKGKFN